MTIRNDTTTVNPSFSMTINGTTTKTGTITWSSPTLPDDYTIISQTLTGTPTYSGKGNVSSLQVNGTDVEMDMQFSVNLGTTLKTSVSVNARGVNRNSTGTLSIDDMTYTINYQYDDGAGGTYNVKIGSTVINNIYLGNTKITKVYIGNILVFEV